jgi:hypothetical protein
VSFRKRGGGYQESIAPVLAFFSRPVVMDSGLALRAPRNDV